MRNVVKGGEPWFVSVPLFGDSFFITKRRSNGTADEVSVPSFGDSFFISDFVGNVTSKLISFRPLIRGFFFYPLYDTH